jgi:hypothetical protein
LKASNATSATETAADRATGRSSGRLTPTLISGDSISLSGPSRPPEPTTNAYRKDLADVALAHVVIASHYAEPLDRAVAARTELRSEPSDDGEVIETLEPGQPFAMLDDTLGWAWGYAGGDRRVGYVRSETLR